MADRDILTGSQSWSSTPGNYSSLRFLQFFGDGSGLAVYGYGQTIYLKANFTFVVFEGGRIRLSYLESPPYQRAPAFVPTDDNRHNDLSYSLTDDQQTITESITGRDFRFPWQIEFDRSPFPRGLTFPYDVPLLYFGYREAISAASPP
jgi:hypothetical protein